MTATSLLTLSTENRPELCLLFWAACRRPFWSEPTPQQIADALNALLAKNPDWYFCPSGRGCNLNGAEPRIPYFFVKGEPFAALTTACMIATVLNEGERK